MNRARNAPIRTILAAAILTTAAPVFAANTSRWSLDVNLASVHTEAWARRDLNQHNPGLGATAHFNRDWSVSAGWYRNSYRRTSAYALVNWTPLHWSLPAGWHIGAGGTAGFDSGYRTSEIACQPLVAAGLLRVIAPQGWSVNLTAVPNAPGRRSGFIGMQVSVPI